MTHRSRLGWADAMDEEPPIPPARSQRLPKMVRVALVGLTAAVFLLLVGLGLMAIYVYQANQYVQGRGEFRDEEAARTNQRINDAICDLLDQLPEGGLLDRPREKYGCGPGIPFDQLPPAVQRELADRRPQSVGPSDVRTTPTPVPTRPPLGGGAAASPTAPSAPPAPSRPTPAAPTASPKPGPVVDLEPITEDVCARLGVCL